MPGEHHDEQDHDHDHGHRAPVADASVRRAGVNDAPAVGLVQAAVWRAAYRGKVPDAVTERFDGPAFASAWRHSLTDPPPGVHALFVALAGAQVVGFVAVGPSQDPDAGAAAGEVTAIGVHPEARRQGHGSRLLNAAADHLGPAGAETMSAWALVDAEDTRSFLTAAGMAPDGAFRDRVVSPEGDVLREVRLSCTLT